MGIVLKSSPLSLLCVTVMGITTHYPLSDGTEGSTNLVLVDPSTDIHDRNKALALDVQHEGARLELQRDDFAPEHNMPLGIKSYGFNVPNGAYATPANEPSESLDNEDVSMEGSKETHTDAALPNSGSSDQRVGRWTLDEKLLFLYGLQKFGKGRWKKISLYVPGRSLVQIKSHAQKVLKRMDTGENVFNRLEENGARVHALVSRIHCDIGWDPLPSKHSPNTPSSRSIPAGVNSDHKRKGKRKRQSQINETNIDPAVYATKSPLGGIEQILAASALCQLSIPENDSKDSWKSAPTNEHATVDNNRTDKRETTQVSNQDLLNFHNEYHNFANGMYVTSNFRMLD